MTRILILAGVLVFSLVPAGASAATASCVGPNPSITHVAVQNKYNNRGVTRYQLVGTVTNVGSESQPSNVLQFVDIYDAQTGVKLDSRGIPPLTVGGTYTFTYAWLRASESAAGSTTLTFRFHVTAGMNCHMYQRGYTLTF